MFANGDYNQFDLSRTTETGPCWIVRKDIDFKDSLYNFIECRFQAKTDQSYHCWAYLGGCCLENLQASLQTTDGTVQMRGRLYSCDPGDKIADPVRLDPAGLPKHHADHGGEKRPARWQWVSLPLPRYERGGMKLIRILSDQQGFAIAGLRISTTETEAPKGPLP